MPSSAQLNAHAMLIEAQSECEHTNAETAVAMDDIDPTSVYRYKKYPGRIPERAALAIVKYWSAYCLSKLDVPPWIKNEMEDLAFASVQPTGERRAHIERHIDGLKVAHRRVPESEAKELVGAKYLLGLSLFILYTSRDRHLRAKHTQEMLDALQLLESALKLGVSHKVVSVYMTSRIAMQIAGGYYNLHEHDFLTNIGLLTDMQHRLRSTKAVANAWKLHTLRKKDATPLHNGVVFCCVLGTPRYLSFARKFLRALIKLDKRFANPAFAPEGLSALGADPLVKHHIKELYPKGGH